MSAAQNRWGGTAVLHTACGHLSGHSADTQSAVLHTTTDTRV